MQEGWRRRALETLLDLLPGARGTGCRRPDPPRPCPRATVRTMKPPVGGRRLLTMSRRRSRSSSSWMRRETPTWRDCGMYTIERPGIETKDVTRAPLVPERLLGDLDEDLLTARRRSSSIGGCAARARARSGSASRRRDRRHPRPRRARSQRPPPPRAWPCSRRHRETRPSRARCRRTPPAFRAARS